MPLEAGVRLARGSERAVTLRAAHERREARGFAPFARPGTFRVRGAEFALQIDARVIAGHDPARLEPVHPFGSAGAERYRDAFDSPDAVATLAGLARHPFAAGAA